MEQDSWTTILSLPDELLQEIFSNMSTEDRFPLGFVSKRFRHADFELSNKTFDKIVITWYSAYQKIIGKVSSTTEYAFEGDHTETIQATARYQRLFRKAKTKYLKLSYLDDDGDIKDDFERISSLFKTVSYDYLYLNFYSSSESPDKFIRQLTKNRDLTNKQVFFKFYCKRSISKADIEGTRQQLVQLPMMNNFKLEWEQPIQKASCKGGPTVVAPEYEFLDDAALLHIVSTTNHAELCSGSFTTNGILKAFEQVCESMITYKYVKFFVPKTNTIDDLFETPNLRFGIQIDRGRSLLLDRVRRSVLIASGNWIWMCKIDDQDKYAYNSVSW